MWLSYVQCDITSTLRSRLEMIADEAEEGGLSTDGGVEKPIHQLTLDELRLIFFFTWKSIHTNQHMVLFYTPN